MDVQKNTVNAIRILSAEAIETAKSDTPVCTSAVRPSRITFFKTS